MEKLKSKTAIAKFIDQLPNAGENLSLNFNKDEKAIGDRIGETLIFELPSGKKVKFIAKLVDPKKCKIWKGNVRIQEFLNEANTNDLKEKIKAQGQLVPVLARPLKNDVQYTHEIIYGSRRHFVCSLLGQWIKILEADLEDSDALLFMDAENSGREEMSPYETAMAYTFWIENGIFKNQVELSEKLGITRSWLNKIISLSRIPKEIILIINDPKKLTLKIGLGLVKYLSANSATKEALVQKAVELKNKGFNADEILNQLLENRNIKSKTRESSKKSVVNTIYSSQGKPLCRILKTKKENAILKFDRKIPLLTVSNLLHDIENLIKTKLCDDGII